MLDTYSEKIKHRSEPMRIETLTLIAVFIKKSFYLKGYFS